MIAKEISSNLFKLRKELGDEILHWAKDHKLLAIKHYADAFGIDYQDKAIRGGHPDAVSLIFEFNLFENRFAGKNLVHEFLKRTGKTYTGEEAEALEAMQNNIFGAFTVTQSKESFTFTFTDILNSKNQYVVSTPVIDAGFENLIYFTRLSYCKNYKCYMLGVNHVEFPIEQLGFLKSKISLLRMRNQNLSNTLLCGVATKYIHLAINEDDGRWES